MNEDLCDLVLLTLADLQLFGANCCSLVLSQTSNISWPLHRSECLFVRQGKNSQRINFQWRGTPCHELSAVGRNASHISAWKSRSWVERKGLNSSVGSSLLLWHTTRNSCSRWSLQQIGLWGSHRKFIIHTYKVTYNGIIHIHKYNLWVTNWQYFKNVM